MNRKVIVLGTMFLVCSIVTTTPVFAETGKDTARIEKLEERTVNLEARMAKAEAASQNSQKEMGMMKHDHGMQGQQQGMAPGMNNPMGQVPQQVPQQNSGAGAAMPQGGAQQQGNSMPPAMGDM